MAVVTRNPIGDMTLVVPNASDIASSPSSLYYWNGTDLAYTASTSFPSFSMTTYYTFSSNEFTFGYQIGGSQFGTPQKVLVIDEFKNPPLPNAVGSSGDFLSWATTFWDISTGRTKACIDLYGTIDQDTPVGLYRQLLKFSTLSTGDVVRIPFYAAASSWIPGTKSSGYGGVFELIGSGKTYFSTLEYDGTTTKYGFWSFKNVQDFTSAANEGVYETQHQPFSKKVRPIEVRVYMACTVSS